MTYLQSREFTVEPSIRERRASKSNLNLLAPVSETSPPRFSLNLSHVGNDADSLPSPGRDSPTSTAGQAAPGSARDAKLNRLELIRQKKKNRKSGQLSGSRFYFRCFF